MTEGMQTFYEKNTNLMPKNILYAIVYDPKILKPYDRFVENNRSFNQDRILSVMIVYFTSDDGILYHSINPHPDFDLTFKLI